jgi:hypothetical protein
MDRLLPQQELQISRFGEFLLKQQFVRPGHERYLVRSRGRVGCKGGGKCSRRDVGCHPKDWRKVAFDVPANAFIWPVAHADRQEAGA